MPAIVDRSPLVIAISSGGQSPVLTRILRARLEALIPNAYARLAFYAAEFRQQVKHHFLHQKNRRIFWEKALQGKFSEMVLAGKDKTAQVYLQQLLENEKMTYLKAKFIWLAQGLVILIC